MIISLIIPSYNRAKILPRTLDSILAQSYTDWECILVDDHSNDETRDVVRSYIEKDNRIIYILNSRKKGAQGARNTGLMYATGDCVVLFDSDNVMHSDFLTKVCAKLVNEKADVCGCFSRIIDENTGSQIGAFKWVGYGRLHDKLLSYKTYFDNSSSLIRKQLLFDVGLLDENCPSYQEWDTHLRISKIAKYTTVEEELIDYYRGGTDTISNNQVRAIKGTLYILEKYKREFLIKAPRAYFKFCHWTWFRIKQLPENVANQKFLFDDFKSQTCFFIFTIMRFLDAMRYVKHKIIYIF